MSKTLKNNGILGSSSTQRQYLQEAVARRQWELDQQKQGLYGCRTLEDMSEEEIRALETHYKCPVIRPKRKRRIVNDLTFLSYQVDEGEGWVGACYEIPGPLRWGSTWEDALDHIMSVYVSIDPVNEEEAEAA